MLREIDDLVEYGKIKKTGSIILSLDYEKAFDTLSTKAILKALYHFGFGETFINWIKIILFERKSCIKNGGYLSDFFVMHRGVRQGCPISPILFILTVEIFAKYIRNNETIKGIKIPGSPEAIKIRIYADDTSLFLSDLIDYREILSKIKEFSEATGLKLNKMKSNAMFISDTKQNNTIKNGIKFVNRMKILGIIFSNECSSQDIKENYTEKIDKLERMCTIWSKRKLTIIGKIAVIKSFGISLFIHTMQSIGISRYYLDIINKIIFRFIWKKHLSNNKPIERVKRNTICSQKQFGGLNMIDIYTMQNSFLLEWAEKYLSQDDEPWKFLVHFFLKRVGGRCAFKSNLEAKSFKGLDNIKTAFWKNVLCTWLNKRFSSADNIVTNFSPLFNNKNITFKNQTIYMPQCFSANIFLVGDIVNGNETISFTNFQDKYGKKPDAHLVYNVLYNAIKNLTESIKTIQENYLYFRENKVGDIGRKGFFQFNKKQ